jgi:hypothetical protein
LFVDFSLRCHDKSLPADKLIFNAERCGASPEDTEKNFEGSKVGYPTAE